MNTVPENQGPHLSKISHPWWKDSFYQGLYWAYPLKSGKRYGPFYWMGGENFSLKIGDPDDARTEKQCFFGFIPPLTDKEYFTLYGPGDYSAITHVHKFYIEFSENYPNAYLFVGPAKGGTAFQISANVAAVEAIRKNKEQIKTIRLGKKPGEGNLFGKLFRK